MSKEALTQIKRRDFLKAAGLGGVAGAAVVATHAGETKAADVAAPGGKGYHETSHVRRYYELAKF